MEYASPLAMLFRWEKITPERVFLRQPIDDRWHTWTWKEAAGEVRRMAAALKAMNLAPGSNIALISKNCAHWVICDLAIMMAGHVSVPLYPNLNAETVRLILVHSDAKVLFVGKLDDWQSMKPGVPEAVTCISFPFYPHTEYINWQELLAKHEPLGGNEDRVAADLATIIYTSGTTGMPKGVMHSFHNFFFILSHALPHLGVRSQSKFFSYLPLSHIAERLLVEMGSLYCGGEIFFTESLEKFPANLLEAEPTAFFAVHRIWKKFQQGILEKVPQKRLDTLLRIPILSGIIKRKIRKGLGLGKAESVFTGASPTPVELIQWFGRIGIFIQEAYGLTENGIYSNITLKSKIKPGFVGQSFPACDVKLGEQQEILIKHDALMMGYFKDPAMSEAAFTSDGYLKTGDEGLIDEEGFLKITGRIKELFKTSKGKYVSPSPIEMKISGTNDIDWVCVTGSGLPQPIALIVLNEADRKKSNTELEAKWLPVLHALNTTLNAHEHLGKLVLLKDDWSVENGMLTPSLKIKRNEVEKKYRNKYESWYEEPGHLVWGEH